MKLISEEAYLKHTQTPGSRHKIDEIFAPVLILHNIIGFQVLNPSWSWQKIMFKLICSILIITYTILGTVHFIQTSDDFLLCTEGVFTLIITSRFMFHMFFFVFNRFTFCEVYFMAKTSLFSVIEKHSPGRSAYLITMLKNMTIMLFVSIITPTLNYLLPALWFYSNGIKITLSPSTSILMPMESPTFEIGLMLHLIFFIIVTIGTLTVHMWLVAMIFFLCEACDCAAKILKTNRIGADDALYAKRLNETLAKFYSVHVELIKYLSKLNELYNWPMLVAMVACYILTCTFLLIMSKEINRRLALVVFLEFIAISAFNVLGERIKMKIVKINMALLNFDWMNMRLKDRKNYFIIMCYMNQNFGIRNAVGVELSLITLTSIFKGSYQAYAVLNTMNN